MLYRDFGKTGWKISAVGLGTWNIGNQWGAIDDATSWAIVRAAFDNGINLFDSAESYGIPNGLSEERLGTALSGIRHRVRVVTKIAYWGMRTGAGVPKTTPDLIRGCAHACLHRLRTDWVDVMLCHDGEIEDPSVYLEAFEMLKQRGRVLHYGISTDSLEVLKRFNVNGTCDVLEADYSLLNREPEEELFPYCRESGIAVLIRGPLAMGLLSGKYSAQTRFTDSVRSAWHKEAASQEAFEKKAARVDKLRSVVSPGREMVESALRFAFSHPVCPVVIPGATSPEQAAMNAAAGERELTAEERERLIAAKE